MVDPVLASGATATMAPATISEIGASRSGNFTAGTIGLGVRTGVFVAGLAICLIVSGVAGAPAQAQETVPGPWGDLVDPVKPLQLETADAKVLHLRRQQMRAMSAHFRSIEATVRYGAPNLVDLSASADALAGLSAGLTALFGPEWGSTSGSRGAKPEIWTQRDRFERHLQGFAVASERLAADARAGGQLRPALTAVRHQCLACHQSFRAR